ncbi:MAG: hypothetical protein ACPGSD_17155 [Flavobacteriales bacterium]
MKYTILKYILWTMLMFSTWSFSFGFELSSNQFSGYQTTIRGKEIFDHNATYFLNEALMIESGVPSTFSSEPLPPILLQEESKFYFYVNAFNPNDIHILADGRKVESHQLELHTVFQKKDTLHILEIRIPNHLLKANKAVTFECSHQLKEPVLIYKQAISQNLSLSALPLVYKKDGDLFQKIAIKTSCIDSVSNLEIVFGTHKKTFDITPGFDIMFFDIPIIDRNETLSYELWINGISWGEEDIHFKRWNTPEIHLTPYISAKNIDLSAINYPVEINSLYKAHYLQNPNKETHFSVELNSAYQHVIGRMQEQGITSFSAFNLKQTNYTRAELNKYNALNVETLGQFASKPYAAPTENNKNWAYLFTNGWKDLLVYKQYNTVKAYKTSHLLNAIAYHLIQLDENHFDFNKSHIFIPIYTQKQLEDLKNTVITFADQYHSPFIKLSSFKTFGKSFRSTYKSTLKKTDQIESPFLLSYPENKTLTTNRFQPICSDLKETLTSYKIQIFNPLPYAFSGIVNIKHRSTDIESARDKDQNNIPIQKTKDGEYILDVAHIAPFQMLNIVLSDNSLQTKGKLKVQGLKPHKKSGIINWNTDGSKISKKKQALFIPELVLENGETPKLSKKTKVMQGPVFYEVLDDYFNQDSLLFSVSKRIFHNKNHVQYKITEQNNISNSSLHVKLNQLVGITKYSIDRVFDKELGYSEQSNFNVLQSKESVFLYDDTKLVLNSDQGLNWQYNSTVYNPFKVGYLDRSSFPRNLKLLIRGSVLQTNKTNKTDSYTFDVIKRKEKEQSSLKQNKLIIQNNDSKVNYKTPLFNINNANITIVGMYETDKNGQVVLELKNTSSRTEKAQVTPRKPKSKVYHCHYSGKKTGIVKDKLQFEPFEIKTIRITL